MSLNTAHANGGVLIYNGEIILLYCNGVELQFEGCKEKEFLGTKKGRLYLTTHRMIFTNKSSSDAMQSFSFPFFSMSKIELEQPIFGANYIKGIVTAQQGGHWIGEAVFKLKFMSGGAIEYGQAMLDAARRASRYAPPQPPPYTPQEGPYYPAPPPAYTVPAGGCYGFVPPTHVFPDAPPANTVFMSNMPPPYPGLYPPPYGNIPVNTGLPTQPPSYSPAAGYASGPPPPGFNAGVPPNNNQSPQGPPGSEKAFEAFGPAYNLPYNPHHVYVPSLVNGYARPQHDVPPPPYSESDKKQQ